MRRRLSIDFAADIAAMAAILAIVAMALVAWHASGFVRNRLRGDAEASSAPAGGPPHATEIAPLSSAELTPTTPKAAASKPMASTHNVILITIDTLRFDLGFMGYPRPVSANIDAFAAESVVYEHAYAMASFTPKCLGPLLIGRYSSETHRDYAHYTNFDPANLFLAERVQAGGGHTAGAASHRYFGWKKGFDQGFDVWDTSAIPPNSIDNDPTITSDKLTDIAIDLLSSARAADIPVRRNKPVVTQARTGPARDRFFAWFHYLDPHLPYVRHEGAPSFASMASAGIPRERAPYDAEVWFTDREVGRLLKHIAAQPWAQETAIILSADHGEAFGEHGHWGHGRELWEPLVRVPLLVRVPGTAPRRIQAKRSHIDIVPTILELMGLAGDADLHGTSLLQDFRGPPAEATERDVYIDMPDGPYNEMRRAVLTGPSPGIKLIDFGNGRYELYDLRFDPNETKNLAFSDAGQLRAAKEALSRVRGTLKELPPRK
jgi:arylsulfatase A-like enzyme